MKKTVLWITIVLSMVASLSSQAFEYRIINAVPDTTLNGIEVYLRDEADVIQIAECVVKDGIMEISGESERSFPGLLIYRSNKGMHPSRFIVEPGDILVDPNGKTPICGGALNDGLNDLDRRWAEVDYRTVPSKKILKECFEKNIGNGLGESALLRYAEYCSPDEWTECLNLIDDSTRELSSISDITARMESRRPVWEGQPFTDLYGEGLDGKPAALSDFVGKGKYVIADCWASWCGGCIVEARECLIPLYAELKDNPDVQIIGIAFDDVGEAVKKYGIEWPQIMKCDKYMKKYGCYAIPEIMIFSPDGIILYRNLRGKDLPEILDSLYESK